MTDARDCPRGSLGSLALPLIALAALTVAAPAHAEQSAEQERYQLDVTCAAVTATAVRMPPPPGRTSEQIRALQSLYEKRVQASGAGSGLTPARIAADVDRLQRSIAARLRSDRAGEADDEKAGTASMLRNCAALPAFEVEDRLSKGR